LAVGKLIPISAHDATVEIAISCAQQRNQGLMRALFRGRAQSLVHVIGTLSCAMLLLAQLAAEISIVLFSVVVIVAASIWPRLISRGNAP
jgi:hypothetical protein